MGGQLGPMAGDLLAEEDGGELADVGALGGAEVVDERRHHLRVLRQPLYLLLRLPPGVVVRHQELDQQQLQRLRHRALSLSLPPPSVSRKKEKNPIPLLARPLARWATWVRIYRYSTDSGHGFFLWFFYGSARVLLAQQKKTTVTRLAWVMEMNKGSFD